MPRFRRCREFYHIVSISGLHMVLAAEPSSGSPAPASPSCRRSALGWPIKKIAAEWQRSNGCCRAIASSPVRRSHTIRAVHHDRGDARRRLVRSDPAAEHAQSRDCGDPRAGPGSPRRCFRHPSSFQMSFSASFGLIAGAEWMRQRGKTGPGPTPGAAGRPPPPPPAPPPPPPPSCAGSPLALLGILTTTIIANHSRPGPFSRPIISRSHNP